MTKVGEVAAPRAIYSRINLASGILALAGSGLLVGLRSARVLEGTWDDIPSLFLPGIILLIPAHEWLHWLTAVLLGVPRRECHFGIYWQKLMPYFRADVPVPVRSYRAILLAPGIGLFIALAVPALLTRNIAWAGLVGLEVLVSVPDAPPPGQRKDGENSGTAPPDDQV